MMPKGGRVRASASYHRTEHDPERVWGLYMDPFWAPTWPGRYVPWENMALPVDFGEAVEAIEEAYGKLSGEGVVEVGCQGGIGRTGCVIACFAILDGVAPSGAVRWVRDRYLMRAVETPIQEWWVEWYGARLHGIEPPPMPRR